MARFSVCRGDDGEGPSNRRSRKRQRLPSIDEDEEDAENADARNSGEEDADSSDAGRSGEEDEEETQNPGYITESHVREYTRDHSDPEMVIEERRFEKSAYSLDSSSSKNSPLPVTLFDSDVLDCPICCEPLKTPIFQCDNGHLACSLCCTNVRNRCPSCTLPIGYIRNRAMENVIEASRVLCQNAKYGCKENTSYGNRSTHEKLCVFNPCSCPVPNCNYTGNHKDLNNHVRGNHKDGVIPFYWNAGFSIFLDFNEKTKIYQEKDDGHVIVVQSFRTSHAALVSVSCIAPLAPEVSKFSCSIEIIDGSLKQSFMVKNIQKVKNEQPEDGFMLIPSYIFDGGYRKFSICISRDRFVKPELYSEVKLNHKLVINSLRCI